VNTSNYEYLWDGSQPGWVINRTFYPEFKITVRFDSDRASLTEIQKLRSAVPEFRELPPVKAKEKFSSSAYTFDWMADKEALSLVDCLEGSSLIVEKEFRCREGDLFVNEVEQVALLIEDDALKTKLVKKALSMKVQIREIHA